MKKLVYLFAIVVLALVLATCSVAGDPGGAVSAQELTPAPTAPAEEPTDVPADEPAEVPVVEWPAEFVTFLGEDIVEVDNCGHQILVSEADFAVLEANRAFEVACVLHLHNDTVRQMPDGSWSNLVNAIVVPDADIAADDILAFGSASTDSYAMWFTGTGVAEADVAYDGNVYSFSSDVGVSGGYSNMWVRYTRPATFSIYEDSGFLADYVMVTLDTAPNSTIQMSIGPTSYYDSDDTGPDWADAGYSILRDSLVPGDILP